MSYKKIFENATILSRPFLRNEAGLDLQNSQDEVIYKNYYIDMCNAVADLHHLKPSRLNIEELIEKGFFEGNAGRIGESNIKDFAEREYLFLMAQAKQLRYDINGGRGGMIRGEDGRFNLCPDAWAILHSLGLINNGTLFKEVKPWLTSSTK